MLWQSSFEQQFQLITNQLMIKHLLSIGVDLTSSLNSLSLFVSVSETFQVINCRGHLVVLQRLSVSSVRRSTSLNAMDSKQLSWVSFCDCRCLGRRRRETLRDLNYIHLFIHCDSFTPGSKSCWGRHSRTKPPISSVMIMKNSFFFFFLLVVFTMMLPRIYSNRTRLHVYALSRSLYIYGTVEGGTTCVT